MYDITNLAYPCYISPIYDTKIIYIPEPTTLGLRDLTGNPIPNKFLKLQKITQYVLEGYLVGTQLKFIDCIPLKDFKRNKCNTIYEDRLRLLRAILNDSLADYTKYAEIPNDLVYNAYQLKSSYAMSLTQGHKGVTIIEVDSPYTFGAVGKYKLELYSTRK